jgi:type V secretory pathway adhesin AidA
MKLSDFARRTIRLAIAEEVRLAFNRRVHRVAENHQFSVRQFPFREPHALERNSESVYRGCQHQCGRSKARPYLTANVLHDFFAPGQTTVGETPFNVNFARTWMEVGLGITATFGKRGELYAAIDYNHSLGGQTAHGVTGHAGYRYSW